jgi:hypothetical protein
LKRTVDPTAEVRGGVVSSIVNAMGAFQGIARGLLADRGIHELRGHAWYSLRAFLGCLDAVAKEVGPNTLYQIGRQIPAQAFYPPGMETLGEALEHLDEEYRVVHRGGELGHYRFAWTGTSSGNMICSTPYPCDFDLGVLESLSQRFEPDSAHVHVVHDGRAPCRKLGGDSCTYRITW